jgi:hypothetical protein
MADLTPSKAAILVVRNVVANTKDAVVHGVTDLAAFTSNPPHKPRHGPGERRGDFTTFDRFATGSISRLQPCRRYGWRQVPALYVVADRRRCACRHR